MKKIVMAAALSTLALPAAAQDLLTNEVIVTGSRIEQDDFSDEMPAVGLRREADFLVQPVIIRGDTRDQEQRRQEIRQMLADTIRAARSAGVVLSYGDYIITELTLENYEDVSFFDDRRPDSERIEFLIKAEVGNGRSGVSAAERIERFVRSVPEVGRAQLSLSGDSTLSIVGPDQYRVDIVEQVAADAKQTAARLGDNYGVEIEGLNLPVRWARAGTSEVFLYIPYSLVIVPLPQ